MPKKLALVIKKFSRRTNHAQRFNSTNDATATEENDATANEENDDNATEENDATANEENNDNNVIIERSNNEESDAADKAARGR